METYVMRGGVFVALTPAEALAHREESRRKEAERIAGGGCPHPINEWEHEFDPESILGDAYYCGRCGDLMQVG